MMFHRALMIAVLSGLALLAQACTTRTDTIQVGTTQTDTPRADPVVSGHQYRVVDGDTIHIGQHKIRLLGIDAPERKQRCRRGDGEPWDCGRVATAMLADLLAASESGVSCAIEGEDRYGRLLGVCYAGSVGTGVDVQKALVLAGLAVAEYDPRYRAEERRARSGKRGLWAGDFMRPKDWRAARRKN